MDILDRLRDPSQGGAELERDAAAEIERLRAIIRRWHEGTQVAGTHRMCFCSLCEQLRSLVEKEE